MGSALIVAENISKSFYEADERVHLVFSHLSVKIDPGSFTIIFGASGSGKSTFLNLISGIDTVDTGSLLVGDLDLAKISENERTLFRRKNVGLIFQSYNLIPTLTVEENILFPLELNGINTPENIEFTLAMLKTVGLINRLKDFPEKLSGGEQQRVATVRALAHKPIYLLADEPTGNLDQETAEIVMNLIQTLRVEYKPTTILVSHDQNLKRYADRVLYLENKHFISLEHI
jgi:putative ABC transport system ATP-binding protein